MENITSSHLSNCNMSDLYWKSCEIMFRATYHILTPFYVFLGICGHSLCMIACYRKSKQEPGFLYQVFVAISELLQVIFGGLCYISTAFYGIIGAERRGRIEYSFQSKYWTVWYYAALASPLVNSFITSSLLLSMCMTADRIFALSKPFAYKSSNHKRRQILCFLICIFLGLASSAFDVPRKTVHLNIEEKRYLIGFDIGYTSTIWFTFFSQLRNAIRTVGLILLIIFNSIMIILYRRRIKKVCDMVRDETKEAEKKDGEKTLLILTVYQSISTTVSIACLLAYYFLFSFLHSFATCGIFLMWPVMDFAVGFRYGFDFYFALLISKQFRGFIFQQLSAVFF